MDRVDYQSLVVQDIINLHKLKELNIQPWYQRKSVWNDSQKGYLINTLHEQKPIPAIYVRHSIDLDQAKSIKEVVDGQQRTRAILEYAEDKFPAAHPKYPKKVKFSELDKISQQKFLITAIPVGYLLGATDADVIDIFGRINSTSKTLNAQEKRNALFSGDFKQFCLRQSSERIELWRNYEIFSAVDISRMNEVQFISDLIVNLIEGIVDLSQPKITKYYKNYDSEFQMAQGINDRLAKIMDLIGSLNPTVIKDTIFKRQPIFFSLCLVLDEMNKFDIDGIEEGLIRMDSIYNAEIRPEDRTADDNNFIAAVTSTTQRALQRRIRHDYIKKYIG